MPNLLERVTSSGKYIPFIDGLRFFSIFSVLCYHFSQYYQERVFPLNEELHRTVMNFTSHGFNGVMLFFGISGFVLGTPFVSQYVYNGKKVNIKNYFLRRITRLEPPYIIVLTFLFLLSLFVGSKGGFFELLPKYLASFFYSYNWIYKNQPILNDVFWSLEIEIQFYLLAPVLALVFKLKKTIRRILLLIIILFYSEYFKEIIDIFSFSSLIRFVEYFLAGFLAADLYYEYKDKLKPSIIFDVICLYLFFSFWTSLEDFIPLSFKVFGLIAATNFSVYWKKLLSLKWLTIIGGMCYTIYMIHQRLLYLVMGFLKEQSLYFDNVWLDLALRITIYLIPLVIASIVFFVFVERPTMKKDWWKYRSFKKLFFE